MWAARAACFQATALPRAPRGGGHIRHAAAQLGEGARAAPAARAQGPWPPSSSPAGDTRPLPQGLQEKARRCHGYCWPNTYWVPAAGHTEQTSHALAAPSLRPSAHPSIHPSVRLSIHSGWNSGLVCGLWVAGLKPHSTTHSLFDLGRVPLPPRASFSLSVKWA